MVCGAFDKTSDVVWSQACWISCLLIHFTTAEMVAKKWNGRAIHHTSRYVSVG